MVIMECILFLYNVGGGGGGLHFYLHVGTLFEKLVNWLRVFNII